MENKLKLEECGKDVKLWGNRTKFIIKDEVTENANTT